MGVGVGTQGELIPLSAADYRSRLGLNPSMLTNFGVVMKTTYIRDVPVGVLLIVLAQFPFFGAQYLASFPRWWEFAGIVIAVLMADRLVRLGINLILGFDHAESE